MKYYGERPGVEKIGSHGLFSQTDDKIDLDKVAEEVSNHKGIIWTHVISLRREDAERLRYNNPPRWRDLIRSNVSELADAHNIDLDNLRWYAAFHNKDHHPHVHLMVYSADAKQGWITKRSIDDSEKKTPDIPLENNKEFRSIKNVIIKAAVEFNNTQHIDYYTPRYYTVSLFCRIVCELLCAISRSYNDRDEKLRSQADSKLRSKIAQKKAALGIRPEQSDYENSYEQSL